MSGYPPGTPDQLPGYTWHGALHDLFSLPGFAALAAACFVFGSRFAARDERGWAVYSFFTGLAFTVAFVLASLGLGQAEGLVDLAGLFQRLAVTNRLRLADPARRPHAEIVSGKIALASPSWICHSSSVHYSRFIWLSSL